MVKESLAEPLNYCIGIPDRKYCCRGIEFIHIFDNNVPPAVEQAPLLRPINGHCHGRIATNGRSDRNTTVDEYELIVDVLLNLSGNFTKETH